MDVESKKLMCTLPGHTGRVNSVHWIPPVSVEHPQRLLAPENEVISVCAGGDIMVWKQENDKWVNVCRLDNKGASVTGVDITMSASGVLWVITCSSDNAIRLWKRSSPEQGSEWSLVATLDKFKPHVVETVSITLLQVSEEKEVVLVAAGSVDTRIHLVCFGDAGEVLSYVHLQGHEDWIRSLAFSAASENGTILLASAGQDKRIRLWKITRSGGNILESGDSSESASNLFKKLVEMKEKNADLDIVQEFSYYQDLRSFKINDGKEDAVFSVLLESVLIGHEDWISQVSWTKPTIKDGKLFQPMGLFTASMDATAIIWRPDADSGLWLEEVRVGKIGGNLLGFFGGGIGPDDSVITHGWSGAFHLWKQVDGSDEWQPQVTVSGHLDEVMAVSWDPNYNYLMSVSKDQTTRLWGIWNAKQTWHEIARPQVHGYDFMCATFVNGISHRIVSGAEEKILRVFDAPQTFIDSLNNIATVSTDESRERPLSANVPPLGLSNKPVFQTSDGTLESTPDTGVSGLYTKFDLDQERDGHLPLVLQQPPFEEQLLQRTLWPEIQKLYGHPNEMVSVTCNHKGSLIASGCKAQVRPTEAAIRIWDTRTWKTKSTVQFHKSTVTQLKFSHSDKYLLSVSKARTMAVMQIVEKEDGEVEVIMIDNLLAHSRMLWCCGWAHDDVYFATGSRDVKSSNAKIWTIKDGKICLVSELQFPQPVTVTSFAPELINGNYVAGFGLENGEIAFWQAKPEEEGKLSWSEMFKIDTMDSHIESVRDIEWRKIDGKFQVATCSTDRSVRVFSLNF
eukprot:TRINITY_DN2012_c0_g1_i1.p1 TRINITY_DN2012_c0_g1~~TRINITY_DN2012_c0_g1_i1.p1  ORF type:complete len:830 (-),score=179.32 TRINITY_DN2012_c0_g1_i1:212-2590(-)